MAVNVESVRPYRADWRRGRVTTWLTTVDHKRIGLLYIWTALVFFAIGGVLALVIRTQLATPHEHLLTKNAYNQAVTMHGTTMIFLVIVPILAGFGNYLVPLMIGARDMAFPRLNALSYWLFLFGGVVLMLSFLAKGGASVSIALTSLPADYDVALFNDPDAQAATLPIGPERNTAWGEVDRMATALAPGIPFLWDKIPQVEASNVRGVINQYSTSWDLNFTSLK